MSFFDLPESQKYLEGGLHEQEDVAVYTWGEESYDGLGDALLEGGDDLNDETFGGTDPVGKDFDFHSSRPDDGDFGGEVASTTTLSQTTHDRPYSDDKPSFNNVSSLWDSKSPFSVLPRLQGGTRYNEATKHSMPTSTTAYKEEIAPGVVGASQPRMRTVEEIEAEMKLAVQQRREQAVASLAPMNRAQHPQPPFTVDEVERRMRGHQISPVPSPQTAFQQPISGRHLQPAHERQPSNASLADLHTVPNHQVVQRQPLHERQSSNPALTELQALQLLQTQQQQAAAQALAERAYQQQQLLQQAMMQQNISHALPSNDILQTQHRHQLLGLSPDQQEALRQKAAQQIHEQELLEAKRRRIAMKISRMSRNNDLMTQSDKDFITRIQVSQLMMSDPYEQDFYNQIFQTLVRKRMSGQNLENGSSGTKTETGRRVGRRQNAMQRMEAQVERIISNVRLREKEKDLHSLNHLQGVLGKTSGRSYKAAPRQLLQVGANPSVTPQSHVDVGVKSGTQTVLYEQKTVGRKPDGIVNGEDQRLAALTKQGALILLEKTYDVLLQIEHLRREQPPSEDVDNTKAWMNRRDQKLRELFDLLPTNVPEDASVPHPLISMLMPNKGKKIIPRIVRQLDKGKQLELLLAIVKNISQLDVVANAYMLDGKVETNQQRELELQTQSFVNNVFNGFLPLLMELTFAPVNHIFTILLERADIVQLAMSQPGIALLTAMFTQVAHIKHAISVESDRGVSPPLNDVNTWQLLYDRFFRLLNSHLIALFPSTRMALSLPFGTEHYLKPSPLTDAIDQPVWNFLATFAVHASLDQQQVLVTVLRDKVLENVISANQGWNAEENTRRLANVNLFLNALGLDSSQIAL